MDDSSKKLSQLTRLKDRRKRDISDDNDIRVRDYEEDSVIPYSSDSDRLHRMIGKLKTQISNVQNYGFPLITDAKDLDSTGGVYIP